MILPAYAAAITAADRIHRHFAANPDPASGTVGTLPDANSLAALIDAAFWTSLRREEIYTPRISFAYVGPEQVARPISFATPVALDPKDLTKLAAAVERSGIHLCVWPSPEGLRVWGIARQLPPLCLVLEIVIPGLLVVKRSPLTDAGKFLNIAVLQGDEIKIIDQQADSGLEVPALLASLLRPESQFASGNVVNLLLQLAVSIRAHGRGGMLLVVPGASEGWKESMLHPITYAVTPAFSGLADLMRKDASGQPGRRWEDAMARAVDGIAGLTAVDGATVISADYDLLAFGAKVVRRKGAPQVSNVIVTEPVEGGSAVTAEPAQLGGTRHLAAAQFVQDQQDSIALVASQDGRFTVFGWSPAEEKVHAHRIDVLLL
jgi:hypothetical protein